MQTVKNFFSITETTYKFEIMDIFTLITVINVILVLMGVHWAPVVGIINCVLSLANCVKCRAHINNYVMQISLIILNSYFLTL